LKIQVLSQSFFPDHTGIANYASDFAFYAAKKGNTVEVITGYPFYPQWRKRNEDKHKLYSTEYANGVKILRGYLYVPKKPTLVGRLIQEVSLLISASFNYFRAGKPDVIVVFTTPISLGYLTSIFKKLYKCKLVINVQDFQLEAAASLGMASKNTAYKILSKIEAVSYKNADLVSSISPSMYKILTQKKNLPENKVFLWPNWFGKKDNIETPTINKFRKEHQIDENAVLVGYAGNIGVKQGLELLVDLAKMFDQDFRIYFVIIGEGAALPDLKNYASELSVSNLKFIDLLDQDQYQDFLNDLDIFFLPQKKTEFDVYFPSKLLSLLDVNKLVLLSADKESELYKTFKSENLGMVTEYGDIHHIQKLLNQLLTDKSGMRVFKMDAKQYVQQFYREKVLNEALKKIYNLL
jgi:colanic acid biosynthesis glycosyl transferase WcaI